MKDNITITIKVDKPDNWDCDLANKVMTAILDTIEDFGCFNILEDSVKSSN